jgi:hypothetical protein
MTSPCNVSGDAMDYRDLPIKMRLRLAGKALRKHKVAWNTAQKARSGSRRRGYPPDKQEDATETVLKQGRY